MNVGESDNKLNFEDNPFEFFGINFGEFVKILIPKASAECNSTSVGVALTDVKSSGNKRLTLDSWKLYLNSYTSYHTFFCQAFLEEHQQRRGSNEWQL